MQAIEINIKDESAGDDITLVFDLTLDGADFPNDSVYEFHAVDRADATKNFKVTGTFDAPSAGDISFVLPAANTANPGVYKYRIKEIQNGGAIRTPVKGILELEAVPNV